jgi:argininosuccinate synthase
MKQKVVLAYSGGLDTSVILKWLLERGFDVIAYVGDVGQKDDFAAVEEKALSIGASKVFVEDLKEEFVRDYIYSALQASVLYEGRYLLGTALARPVIAKRQVEIAAKEGAFAVSHGATGKGNDQVRFELAYQALAPELQIISPWKDEEFLSSFAGRPDLMAYAQKHGIPIDGATNKPPYSMDANLMHVSYEGGILEDPYAAAPKDIYLMTADPEEAPDRPIDIEIFFEKGVPVQVKNITLDAHVSGALDIFDYLNTLGSENGIGRIDIVENRYVGIKSRGVYETPGGTILWKAHQDIELVALDREVYKTRELLTPKFAETIYNGYWFSPEMDYLLCAMEKAQESVTGSVRLRLYKGNVSVVARRVKDSLYDSSLASMDVEGGFNQTDSRGFINVNAVRIRKRKCTLS